MPSRKEILLVALVFAATVGGYSYFETSREAKIKDFYSKIENQENLRADVTITDADMKAINRCQNIKTNNASKVEECMRSFYDAYTMKNGVDKAFAHLARLQKEHSELLASCHYISHGIGHAALRLDGGDPEKAFTFMSSSAVFKNIVTCGNGYFHGVVEELAHKIRDKDELVAVFKNVCSNASIKRNGNCYHGVGHAAMIQTDYNIEDMLYICDRISDKPEDSFGCHTGGYMEYSQIFTDVVKVEDKRMKFVLCDAQEKKYQAACYLEQSSFFETFSRERRNYTRNIGFCKQIEDDLNRMACVKLFAIRAVRIVHFKDVYAMCQNTSSAYERVMCTAIMADRIGGSMDYSRKSEEYVSAVDAVCGTLNILHKQYCKSLALENSRQLFYTSPADFRFSPPRSLSGIASLLQLLRLV